VGQKEVVQATGQEAGRPLFLNVVLFMNAPPVHYRLVTESIARIAGLIRFLLLLLRHSIDGIVLQLKYEGKNSLSAGTRGTLRR
jgi:hypothetical protein